MFLLIVSAASFTPPESAANERKKKSALFFETAHSGKPESPPTAGGSRRCYSVHVSSPVSFVPGGSAPTLPTGFEAGQPASNLLFRPVIVHRNRRKDQTSIRREGKKTRRCASSSEVRTTNDAEHDDRYYGRYGGVGKRRRATENPRTLVARPRRSACRSAGSSSFGNATWCSSFCNRVHY